MELRLIFEGDAPLSQNILADVLRRLDRRLFVYEKQALKGLIANLPPELATEYPGLREHLTKDRVAQWRQELNRQYRAGEFSMVYVTAVREGSIEIHLVVGRHVLDFAIASVETLLKGMGFVFAKDILKEQPLYKALIELTNKCLLPGVQERIIKALLDVAKHFKQLPPKVEEVIEGPPGPRRRLLELGPTYDELPHQKVYVAKSVPRDYGITSAHAALPPSGSIESTKALTSLPSGTYEAKHLVAHSFERPPEDFAVQRQLQIPDRLKMESITVRHRSGTPVRVEALIKRITVKGPPLTYI